MKLIRDKYVNIIPPEELLIGCSGGIYDMYLEKKLSEELDELKAADFSDAEEFADVIEVLYALAERNGISKKRIEIIREDKLERLGGFEHGIILKD